MQEELEQQDKDRKLAIEAQDRELAKVLYEKVTIKYKLSHFLHKLTETFFVLG